MADSVLESIQEQMVDRLQADPYFDDITVLTQKVHDIENEIATAVASIGVCVVIVTPTANLRKSRDVKGPYFDEINVVVRIKENVVVNQDEASGGTGKSALAIAENALALLHLWKPDALNEAFYGISPTISIVDLPDGLLTYDVQIQTKGGLAYAINQVATPAISIVGSSGGDRTVQITCATSHANIIYSTNGKIPTPRKANIGSPTAWFYDSTFTAAAGTTITAQAWLPGYIASESASLLLT